MIADKIVEDGITDGDQLLTANQKIGEDLKNNYLSIAKTYAAYQKKLSQPTTPTVNADSLEAMTSAVTKMAEVMQSLKSAAGRLKRLPIPTWDGSRRSYRTWKKEFNHWMHKYSQDKDEQLQRFRKAMPKGSWWTDQVRTCKNIDRAWEILDVEFADKRKIMDELLARINHVKSVKGDSKSLTRYATQIVGYVNDMEDNDCSVTSSSEAPFFMSQLLSKLEPRDNAKFGREMKRKKTFHTLSNGYTQKQVFDQEANLAPRAATLIKANIRERELITTQAILMCPKMMHVHLVATQSILWRLAVVTKPRLSADGRLSKNKDAGNVSVPITRKIVRNHIAPLTTNAKRTTTDPCTARKRA